MLMEILGKPHSLGRAEPPAPVEIGDDLLLGQRALKSGMKEMNGNIPLSHPNAIDAMNWEPKPQSSLPWSGEEPETPAAHPLNPLAPETSPLIKL